MLFHFTFLILSKYGLPIRWALPRFESGISKFDLAQISFTFLSISLEVSLSPNGTPSILKQSLLLYYTALFLHKKQQWLYSVFFLIHQFAPKGDFYPDKIGQSYL